MVRGILLFKVLSTLLLVGGLASRGAAADAPDLEPVPLAVWQDEILLPGTQFYSLGAPSMALDPDGNPHFVYGFNHLIHSWFDGFTWQSERLDMSPVWDRESVLAIDESGTIFISEFHNYDVYLRILEPGGSRQTVRAPFRQGVYFSMALDSQGRPHIVEGPVSDQDHYVFIHGRYGADGWSVERIGLDSPEFEQFSIAIDRQDQPVILYERYDLENDRHEVRLLRQKNQSWQDELLDEGCLSGGNSLALGDQDGVHAVFSAHCDEGLTYAFQIGQAWDLLPVTDYGNFSALALDSAGRPHVVYLSARGQIYATLEGATWQEALVQDAYASAFQTLLLDGTGAAHISWQAKGLQYASNASGQWQVTKVAERDSYGERNALALDKAGVKHILYHKQEARELYWTSGSGSDWETELLANGPAEWLEFTIDVDSQDRPHVAILNQKNELVAGLREAGAWNLEFVAAGGRQLSQAVDSLGRPHLAVIDDQGTLYHWSKEGDKWIGEVVEERLDWMGAAWLALDSQDRPHIAYSDGDGAFLASRQGLQDWVRKPLPFEIVLKLVFGPDDRPYFLYSEERWEYSGNAPILWVSLWFAEPDGEDWSVKWLWEDYYWDAMCDIAVAEDSQVHIALRGTFGDRVYFKRDGNGEWLTEYLFRPSFGDISMAIAQDGQPRMLWYNDSSLMLATREIVWLDEFRFLPVLVP